MNQLEKAKRALQDAETRFNDAADALDAAAEDINEADLTELNRSVDESFEDVKRSKADVERLDRVYKAREESRAIPAEQTRVEVIRNETTYRKNGESSFFSDLYRARFQQDPKAIERLHRNNEETQGELQKRDIVGTSGGGGAGFIPPIWLADEWIDVARAGRPFADKVPTMPMPADGLTLSIPKLSTGVSVAVQAAENNGVSETDVTSTTVTAPLVTIAGQQDIARQALERSFPGLDMVIFQDLLKAYNATLDTQLLNGSNGSGQHQGIRNVSSVNTVTYDDASPTGGELLTSIYGAISQIASNRYMHPNAIIMHPRRAAWLAATQSSTFPIFQQGALFHAFGPQNDGFAGTIAGLPVIEDANVTTVQGASTNQDEVYVVYLDDFRLAEDGLRQATFEEVLSGNLTVRLQLFAYSFWVPDRFPKSIAIISGTGLVAPTGF